MTPLTLTARILSAIAALLGTTLGTAAASTGLGKSGWGAVGVVSAELGAADAAAVVAALGEDVGALQRRRAPVAYRFERGSTAIAAAIPPITRPITATAASTTTAIRLGPKG